MACGKVPELTEDAQSVMEAFQYLPHTFVQRRWTPEEDENLKLAVLRHFQVPFLTQSGATGAFALSTRAKSRELKL